MRLVCATVFLVSIQSRPFSTYNNRKTAQDFELRVENATTELTLVVMERREIEIKKPKRNRRTHKTDKFYLKYRSLKG